MLFSTMKYEQTLEGLGAMLLDIVTQTVPNDFREETAQILTTDALLSGEDALRWIRDRFALYAQFGGDAEAILDQGN